MDPIVLMNKDLSDEALLKSLNPENRRNVLGLLYDRYEKRIYFKAFTMLKNEAEAKDLTHDVFIKIFMNLSKFKGRSAFSLWVHSITVNTVIKYINKKRKFNFHEFDEGFADSIQDDVSDTHDKILLEIKIQQLEVLLLDIKEEDRILLILKYADGLSIQDIVKITKLNPSTVKMRLKRSKEKICILYLKKFAKKTSNEG